ncbi:MAG: hypothetical protein J7M24_01095 [Candidatus Latescibacteria bacterium]|nr:hypothetical protein [Candidatus Latescibacterota bacterium]
MHSGPHVSRLKLVMVVIAMLWLVLWGRVAFLQGFRHQFYLKRANDQRIERVTLGAPRGCIFDRNGEKLADNLSSWSYGVRPSEIANVGEASNLLSKAAGMSSSAVRAKLVSKKSFVWLVRHTDGAMAKRLDATGLAGLQRIEESRRYYPFGKIGAHLIGYTDIDGAGIEGCELYLDDDLTGRSGESYVFHDARGRAVLSLDEPDIKPLNGLDVVLTIDRRIQEIADEELEACVAEFDAVWGGVIISTPEPEKFWPCPMSRASIPTIRVPSIRQ